MRTSVTDYLESKAVAYVVRLHSQEVYTCEDAARERGVRLSQIVKCMIGKDPSGGLHVMLIPGDKTLKLKKVRGVAGGVLIDLVSRDQIAEELGLVVGAISPTQLAGRASFYVDPSLFREETVSISSGRPDAGVELSATDLEGVLGARRCDIVSSKSAPHT